MNIGYRTVLFNHELYDYTTLNTVLALVRAHTGKQGFKSAFGQHADRGSVFFQADSVDLLEAEFAGNHRQERPDRFRGIPFAGMPFRNVIADFPFSAFQRNKLDVPDILPAPGL